MKKLIALIACISVFACMSVSALAATPAASTDKISYTEATDTASGYFTINASEVATGNTQTTIVVIDGVKTVEDGVEKYNISTDTIQYINQQDNASFTVIPKDHDTYLEGATEKTLTVLIGGDNITRKELGTITYAAAGGEEQPTIMYGDCYKDGTVNGSDATRLLQYLAKMDVEIDLDAADTYYDEVINGSDATRLLQYLAKMDVTLGPKTE